MLNNEYKYRAFELTFSSDFPIPELETSTDIADVEIRYGVVPKALSNPIAKLPRFETSENEALLKVDGIAQFYVKDGKEIIIQNCEGASEKDIRVFLLNPVFTALLHQRGLLVWHASAVEVNGKGIIFSGVTGAGKSMIAALLRKKGYKILADDICAVRMKNGKFPELLPGFPRLKLWEDSVKMLNEDASLFVPVRSNMKKYEVDISEDFCRKPIRISKIYILNRVENQSLSVSRLEGDSKIESIIAADSRQMFLHGPGFKQSIKHCIQIAQTTEVYKLSWSNAEVTQDELVTAIEKEIECI